MALTSVPEHKTSQFPCGEPHVVLEATRAAHLDVSLEFERAAEIFELQLLVDAAKRAGLAPRFLFMPYIPFSRQDRVANRGESLSLAVFIDVINSLGFQRVTVADPHSDVSTALLKNADVIGQPEIFLSVFPRNGRFWLASPDAGALKKVVKLAVLAKPLGIIECSKVRNTKTGTITGTHVHAEDLDGQDVYIVDDICDGGWTFIQIAKRLRELNAGKIHLLVTHGFFTRGLDCFDGIIDHIHTRKGQIK